LYNYLLKKENTLTKQRTQQWREYQEKQGHNIDEEYCNSYGRRSLWSKKMSIISVYDNIITAAQYGLTTITQANVIIILFYMHIAHLLKWGR